MKLEFENGFVAEYETNIEAKIDSNLINSALQVIAHLPIFFNDLTCQHWCFDTKLKENVWLTNINFNNELNKVTFYIDFLKEEN